MRVCVCACRKIYTTENTIPLGTVTVDSISIDAGFKNLKHKTEPCSINWSNGFLYHWFHHKITLRGTLGLPVFEPYQHLLC